MKKLAAVLLTVLSIALMGGCAQPPYPKDQIAESIKRLCMDEYSIDGINVKLVGKTLGVQLTVDKLFDGLSKFDDEAREKMEDVLLVLRRVCLSTDAQIDFFTLVVSDRATNLQVSRSGYITDIKKAMFGAISLMDYGQRVKIQAVPDLYLLGRARINSMFKYLNTKKISMAFLAANTDLANKENPLLAKYLVSLLQTSKNETKNNEITELRSHAIAEDTIVFYVRATETFVPVAEKKPTQEPVEPVAVPAQEKPKDLNKDYEFLVWVKIENYKSTIDRVQPLVGPEGTPQELPESLAELNGYKTWPEADFYVADLVLDQFLANQVAQRVQRAFAEMEDNKMVQKLFNIEGKYEDGFVLTFTSKTKETISQMMIDLVLKTAQEVCRSYEFSLPSSAIRIMDKENKLVYELKSNIKV